MAGYFLPDLSIKFIYKLVGNVQAQAKPVSLNVPAC